MAAFAVLSSEKVYIRGVYACVGGTQFNNLMVFMSHSAPVGPIGPIIVMVGVVYRP